MMTEKTPATIRELMLRYLDGSLPESETGELNERLKESQEYRQEFAGLLRQEVHLSELGEKLIEQVTPPQRTTTRTWWRLGLAASVAATVAVTMFGYLYERPSEPAYRFTRVSGEVWVERGDVRYRATTALTVLAGDHVQTERAAEAEVQFLADSTHLRLREVTSLLLPSPGRRIVALEEGTVSASVAPQPLNDPLIFSTPQSEARVIGTELVLSSDARSTHLAVTEGLVRLRRLSDGAQVEVGAKQFAIAADDTVLAPRPLPVSNAGTGLLGEYFPGKQFALAKVRRVDPQVQFDWDKERPVPGLNFDHFQIRWTGLVQPKFSERYTFELVADDGVRLWVDGHLLVDEWDIRNRQTSMHGQLDLVAGRKYDLTLEYLESSGRAFVSLYWQSESQPREVIPQAQLYPANH